MTIQEFADALATKGYQWELKFAGARIRAAGDEECGIRCPIHMMWPGPESALKKAIAHGMSEKDAIDVINAADNFVEYNPAVRDLLISTLRVKG